MEVSSTKRQKMDPPTNCGHLLELLRGGCEEVLEFHAEFTDAMVEDGFICKFVQTEGCIDTLLEAAEIYMTDNTIIGPIMDAMSWISTVELPDDRKQSIVDMVIRVMVVHRDDDGILQDCCNIIGNIEDAISPDVSRRVLRLIASIGNSFPGSYGLQFTVCWAIKSLMGRHTKRNLKVFLSEGCPRLITSALGIDPDADEIREYVYQIILSVGHHADARRELVRCGALRLLLEKICADSLENQTDVLAYDAAMILISKSPLHRRLAVSYGAIEAALHNIMSLRSEEGGVFRKRMEFIDKTCFFLGKLTVDGDRFVARRASLIRIDRAFIESFCASPSISSVSLDRIDDDCHHVMRMLAGYSHVKSISLEWARIDNSAIAILMSSPSLTELDISETMINSDVACFLRQSSSLKEVMLLDTVFGDAGMRELAKSMSITEVNVSGSMVTPIGVREFESMAAGRSQRLRKEMLNVESMRHIPEVLISMVCGYVQESVSVEFYQ